MKLYELTGAFNQVADMLEYDSENTAIIDTLESIDLAIEEKADGYAKLIRNQEASSKAFDEEIKRMKLSLQNAMVEIGKTKFKTDLFSFNIQKNQPSVEIIDETLIPDKFKKITIDFDKTAIKKAEEDVPGVEIKQSESLRIR